MTDSPKFSELQLYFGDPYSVSDQIQVYQPTIGDILEYDKKFGEAEFWALLNIFIGNPTSYRLLLWDMGIDWNEISDYQLFMMLCRTVTPDKSEILFGDLDFTSLELCTQIKPEELTDDIEEEFIDDSEEDKKVEIVLFDPNTEILINEAIYLNIADYLRTMFGIFPKVEKAKGQATKEWIIEEERMNLNAKKNEDSSSTLFPLISACCCHPGFKYKKNELREVGIYEFMDAVSRLQIYESTTALLKGIYSGFVDGKGIDSNEFDFMREIKHDNDKYKHLK